MMMACLRAIGGELGERVIESLKDIAPDLERVIIEFSFGEVYVRPQLDLLSLEMVTVAAMGNATPQLKVHMHGLLNVGGTREQLAEVVTHIAACAGLPCALNAWLAAKGVLSDRAHAVHCCL